MGSDLEAAVARLERDLDAIAAETPGAREARGDVRLLLADWQRLRELTSPAAGWSRLEKELSTIDTPIAERDAARAEVAQVLADSEKWREGMADLSARNERMHAELERLKERRFPLQGGPSLPWALVAPHDAQCQRNHGGQTLERISARGGLSPAEVLAVLEERPWHQMDAQVALARVNEYLRLYANGREVERLQADLARLRERDARVRTKVEALQQCFHSEACMTSEDGWTSHHPDCQELREALALLKETP